MDKERRGITATVERPRSPGLGGGSAAGEETGGGGPGVAGAEEEGAGAVEKLEGAAGGSEEGARRYVRELTERLQSQRKEIEKTVDDRVRTTLARVKAPRREQITDLQRRLDRVA